jgi:hypothetical protein
MIDRAVAACLVAEHTGPAARLIRDLARGPTHPEGPALVDRALGRALVDAVTACWARGWQPADLHRMVERTQGRAHGRVSAVAMGMEAQRYADGTVPARWRHQLDAVGAEPPADGGDRWAVPAPIAAEPTDPWGGGGVPSIDDRADAIRVAVETLSLIRRLPPLPKLAPGPGESNAAGPRPRPDVSAPGSRADASAPGGRADASTPGSRAESAARADPRILHRVSALLAKAESTTFPDEAEALTAKAQQLITRHAIDTATLDAERGAGPDVVGRRIGVDDPYARARVTLLDEVARANGCRAVWSQAFGFATVFGAGGDVDAVEMLFTSLLVQATRAMVAAGAPGRGGGARGGSATRSFRQSFLVAYAGRIGERLRQAADAAVAEADADPAAGSARLLPVLVRRADAAEAAAKAAFPRLHTFSTRASDADGWAAGRQAADRAQLGLQGTLEPRPARRPRSLGAA